MYSPISNTRSSTGEHSFQTTAFSFRRTPGWRRGRCHPCESVSCYPCQPVGLSPMLSGVTDIKNDAAHGKPYQLASASNTEAGGGRNGSLATKYDLAGNLTDMAVSRSGAC